jgi:hypothetical protein
MAEFAREHPDWTLAAGIVNAGEVATEQLAPIAVKGKREPARVYAFMARPRRAPAEGRSARRAYAAG